VSGLIIVPVLVLVYFRYFVKEVPELKPTPKRRD
jgi:hypothetical protein